MTDLPQGRAFAVMPFGPEPGPEDKPIDFDAVYEQLLKPAIEFNAGRVLSALMYRALTEQNMLCRVFGDCLVGDVVDSEPRDLVGEHGRGPVESKLFNTCATLPTSAARAWTPSASSASARRTCRSWTPWRSSRGCRGSDVRWPSGK